MTFSWTHKTNTFCGSLKDIKLYFHKDSCQNQPITKIFLVTKLETNWIIIKGNKTIFLFRHLIIMWSQSSDERNWFESDFYFRLHYACQKEVTKGKHVLQECSQSLSENLGGILKVTIAAPIRSFKVHLIKAKFNISFEILPLLWAYVVWHPAFFSLISSFSLIILHNSFYGVWLKRNVSK